MALEGQRFGRLVIIAQAPSRVSGGQTKRYVEVRCDCGLVKEVRYTHLLQGRTIGCGCKRPGKSKHYMTNTRLHNIWCGMRQRCYDEGCKTYQGYGAKGVTVCDDWRYDFIPFMEWSMANGYEDTLTIDRVNNHKEYCPEHCEWVTLQENIRRRDVCKAGGRI